MDARNNIATDLFYKIRSRFSGLKLGAETGQITINPSDARFFDFDYMEGKTAIGHVSISLAESHSLKVYFSSGITESMDSGQKNKWYGFLKELRQFAKRRLMSFDTRDIAKDMLDKRDFEFLSQNSQTKPSVNTTPTVGESVMSESAMYGSRTMSYQKLMDTRLIVKHSKAVMDDLQPGARTRNISALFVENQDGERFKYPFIHLAGARAMQRHVANTGVPYDEMGKSIVSMSEEIAQLKSFSNYVVRNDLMNSDNNSIIERGQARLESLREQIKALSKQSHYENYKENFQAQEQLQIPESVIQDFTEKFTVKNFREDIKSAFPALYRLMQEENTIGYDDIVAMTQEDISEHQEPAEAYDAFDKFEQWAMNLGEESAISSQDEETQTTAVKELQELIGEKFSAGVDGTNAIESLKGIIEDPQLNREIKELAKQDPDVCVRPLVKTWLEQNAPEAMDQLDFGDMADQPADGAEMPAGEPVPRESSYSDPNTNPQSRDYGTGDDEDDLPFEPNKPSSFKKPNNPNRTGRDSAKALAQQGMKKAMDVNEVAQFINSFYDRDSGTFPKGPEGVCTMVGKKFGEQAEQVARRFVERMAPGQEQGAEQMQELARIRELAGMPSNKMAEDDNGIRDDLAYEIEQILDGAIEGTDQTDHIIDELGDLYDRIESSGDKVALKAYSMINGSIDQGTRAQVRAAQMALKRLKQEEGVAEGSDRTSDKVADALEQKGVKYAAAKEQEIINMIGEVLVDMGMDAKKIQSLITYDQDFISDVLDALPKEESMQDSITPELEHIKRLSGIAQGIGY